MAIGTGWADGAWQDAAWVSGAWDGSAAANVSGSFTEAQIVAGGQEIVITLLSETWVTAGATFNAQRQNILDGLTSAQSETLGWNNEVRDKEVVTSVVRTSDTVVTITLTASPLYDITADESITVTVPGTALTGGSPLVGPSAITVSAEDEDEERNSGGWAAQNWYDSYRQKKLRRKKRRKEILEEIKELESVEREIAKLMQKDLEREERDKEIKELENMVKSTFTRGQLAQARMYNERAAKAYARAANEPTFAALEIFEREMERAKEEEEILFLAMLL